MYNSEYTLGGVGFFRARVGIGRLRHPGVIAQVEGDEGTLRVETSTAIT